MNFRQLFLRDAVFYRKSFLALAASAALVGAILTSALLIGDSVRGTQYDLWNANTAFVNERLRFPTPVRTELPGAVLHATGLVDSDVSAHVYAFPDSPIQGRDAYCSSALAEKLQLQNGDLVTVRLQTISAIESESLAGLPPELRQIQFVYRGIWPGKEADGNFENTQLRANNLFVGHEFLAQTLGLEKNAVNEVWLPEGAEKTALSEETVWELSSLYFDEWEGRPLLKSRQYFLPQQIPALFPDAEKGLTTFAESFSTSTDELRYFFVGAFEKSLPVAGNHALLSGNLPKKPDFAAPATLTFFQTDAYRKIVRAKHVFTHVAQTTDDALLSAVLNPEIPGLTDAADCSHWKAGLPIDFDRITQEDQTWWERYQSKPKLYLNFQQAQELFCPGKCTVLIFDADANREEIQAKIVAFLREQPNLFLRENVAETLRQNIDQGIHFATLFLGLSFFIIVSALLVLGMLLRLHLFDRREALNLLAEYVPDRRKWLIFQLLELAAILLPGTLAGLVLGVFLCQFQLRLLENVWNGIVLMNRLHFHARAESFLLAFGLTFLFSFSLASLSLASPTRKKRYFLPHFHNIPTPLALGTLTFFRLWGEYRRAVLLLILGFLGTLGVGAFGIKNRGEDGFSHAFVAETILPVVPPHDAPFPPGGLAVRVKDADSADCSNLLRAETPTVYGCDLAALTGDAHFLNPQEAAADAGSLLWIMKKKIGDVIRYPHGNVTLRRSLKASVFQRGILVDRTTFETLFPEVQGARFFLIRDEKSAEAYRKYLASYGLTLTPTDAFMARAESFQNRYLAIFLQLGGLGFLLGLGSLLLLMVRNWHARQEEIRFLSDLGFSRRTLFAIYLTENLWLYLLASGISLALLCLLTLAAGLAWHVLLMGWILLTTVGTVLITLVFSLFFRVRSR